MPSKPVPEFAPDCIKGSSSLHSGVFPIAIHGGLSDVLGKSLEHPRIGIQDRLQELAANDGINCLSFAVMVNHVHVKLRNRPDVVSGWSDEEVA